MESLRWVLGDVPVHHYLLEACMVLALFVVYLRKPRKATKSELTRQEEEELLEEFSPEPLVKGVAPKYFEPPTCEGVAGATVMIQGEEKINLATLNFLGFVGDQEVEDAAVKAVKRYGVGSCGPRGFYGTIDVHLELEKRLAEFMGAEEAIIYAFGFSTIASAIPAYNKRGDIIYWDEGVSFATQKGLVASRSKLVMFKHNDVDDLEAKLMAQDVEDKKNPKKAMATRRFIVVEGLYANHGDICPLPKLVELKYNYKTRLMIEETMSFGVLGAQGRGVTEHFNVSVEDVDCIAASMGGALGTVGGFCCGRSFVIDHQRLSGQGYCFSASLPPMLASAALVTLRRMETKPATSKLHANARTMRKLLSSVGKLQTTGVDFSPLIHLHLRGERKDNAEEDSILHALVEQCLAKGVALTTSKYVRSEEMRDPRPSIRLAVSAAHTHEQLEAAARAIKDAASAILA